MSQTQAPSKTGLLKRLLHMAMGVAIAVALTGYFVGLSNNHPLQSSGAVYDDPFSAVERANIPTVVDYKDRPTQHLGPNANQRSNLQTLRAVQTDLFATVVADPDRKQAALQQRASRRAYDGAPPTIPHAITQMNPAVCLVCHGEGKSIGTLTAPAIPHEPFSNCTQCHVESSNRQFRLEAENLLTVNSFSGRSSAQQGPRYWDHAPPTIPHTVWMRDNCLSCHGTLGKSGMQSSHPWRNSCTQCHALSADQDQRDFLQALQQSRVFSPKTE